MGLTDSQEQTKIDKFKSIVVKKVDRKSTTFDDNNGKISTVSR